MRVPTIKATPKPAPQPRFDLHPEGTFTAEFVEWGEIKRSKINETRFHMSGMFRTQHGVIRITFGGLPDGLMFMRTHPPLASYLVKVKHEWYDGRPYAHGHIVYDNELRRQAHEPPADRLVQK